MIVHTLSDRKIQVGYDLLRNLEQQNRLPIVAAFWFYYIETSKWRLILASPEVRRKGPTYFYRAIQSFLLKLGDRPISLNEIQVVDDSDPFIVSLLSDLENLEGVSDKRLDQLLQNMVLYKPRQ